LGLGSVLFLLSLSLRENKIVSSAQFIPLKAYQTAFATFNHSFSPMGSSTPAPDNPEVFDHTDEFFERPEDERPSDTTEASPIFGGIMAFWFAAFGAGGAYLGITNYLAGAAVTNPHVLFPLGGALVMGATAGATVKMTTWRSPTVPKETPWELRLAWQSSIFEEELYFRSVRPRTATTSAIVGGVMLYPWLKDAFSTGNLLFLILPLASLIPAVFTLLRVWHRRKFGTSTLKMNTMPGRLGQPLDARVWAGVDPGMMQSDAFQVTLTCYHRNKSGNETSWLTVWEAEASVEGQSASNAPAGPPVDGKVEIPISLDLPVDAPRSTPEKKFHRIAWILEVSAETTGLNYQSYFEIPVFEPEEPSESGSGEPTASAVSESFAQDSAAEPDRSPHTGPSATDERSSPDEPLTDRYGGETDDRSADGPGDNEDLVRCDNCHSTVDASASTCPACGADMDSGWFS
jgi:hypothetical protein